MHDSFRYRFIAYVWTLPTKLIITGRVNETVNQQLESMKGIDDIGSLSRPIEGAVSSVWWIADGQ
ncbi:hypothetical protein V6615_06715 [Oscillospiraceae bacterium PP1C4]